MAAYFQKCFSIERINALGDTMKKARHIIAALALVPGFTIFAVRSMQGQTFTVLHNFSGRDGANPYAGLTMDTAGRLYGTAVEGGFLGGPCAGLDGCGTVFRLTHKNSGWILESLYTFQGQADGSSPFAGVVTGPDGALYGTTIAGGGGSCTNGRAGCGTIFRLVPPPTTCAATQCPWQETVIHAFQGGSDGWSPAYGSLLFDIAGNIYGTTQYGGGPSDDGTVYEATGHGGGWTESVLYVFAGQNGEVPSGGVIFDQAGHLLGTTTDGGPDDRGGGIVFQLTHGGNGWTENILYPFSPFDPAGSEPLAGLLLDGTGNLYGTTGFGITGYGTVFQLAPSGATWTLDILYSFPSYAAPIGSLVADASGNLYGTVQYGGIHGQGVVFELMPSGGSWTYYSLHDFTGGSDGGAPAGSVLLDANGNVYGTASLGGTRDAGIIWEISR